MDITNIKKWKTSLSDSKKLKNYQHIDQPLDIGSNSVFLRVVKNLNDFKSYQFLPFIKRVDKKIKRKKIYLPNGKSKLKIEPKPRPIMYASHKDSLVYSYFSFLLQEKYNDYLVKNNIDSNIIAYRKIEIKDSGKGKSNIHFAKEVFDHIRSRGDCAVITQDIKSFFDNLDHTILKKHLLKILDVGRLNKNWFKIYESITKHKYIKKNDLLSIRKKLSQRQAYPYEVLKGFYKVNTSGKGIPQGSPISGVLANIYLIDFDLNIKNNFPDIFYRRYSDDLVFVCNPEQVENVLKKITDLIKIEKLEIQNKKTFITEFQKNIDGLHNCLAVKDGDSVHQRRKYVDYLGFEFDGKRILLRKRTVQSLKNKHEDDKVRREKNRETPKNKKKRKSANMVEKVKNRSRLNYFSRTSQIIQQKDVNKQVSNVLKLKTKRNNQKNR